MLDKVKLALRISGSAFDEEVTDLINAAIADLRLVGISVPETEGSPSERLGDPLLERAIVLYAKAEFGWNNDAERYRKAYDYLKCALSLSGDHTSGDHAENTGKAEAVDYETLINKPKLDGKTIVGDVSEADPTVPEWAKQSTRPVYTADDVGAIGEGDIQNISVEALQEMWKST